MAPDSSAAALRTIKLIHTVAWAFFASCIVLIPFYAIEHRLAIAVALIAIVLIDANATPILTSNISAPIVR